MYTNFIIILSVVVVVVLGLHYYLYNAITSKNDNTLIWVPPKPKQQLPFGLGPPIEPIKIDDYEKTTYKDYEIKLLRESVQSIVMSGGISYLMSMKFGQMSLLIQAIMIPVNLFDAVTGNILSEPTLNWQNNLQYHRVILR